MTSEDLKATLAMLEPGATWPVHPDTGEAFVSFEYVQRTDRQRVQYLRRGPPSRTGETYDDDGEVIATRELTDEEFAQAWAAWKKADDEWVRTGGMFYTVGSRQPIEFTFRTASGATAYGVWGRSGWVWWETKWG